MAPGPGSTACSLAWDNLHRLLCGCPLPVKPLAPELCLLLIPQPHAPQALFLLLSFPVCWSVTRQECNMPAPEAFGA